MLTMTHSLPTFDLIVSTLGRTEPLRDLFLSLGTQTYQHFRVILIDQNDEECLAPIVSDFKDSFSIVWERKDSGKGLSRGRNRGLALCQADIVAFPDDDCMYAPDTLEKIARAFLMRVVG